MSERVISILLSARDATASAFDRAKGGVKDLAKETQTATAGMKAANMAYAKAVSGDLVGAAKSAATAFKALWSVMLANPLAAVAAIAVAAALGIAKLWYNSKMAAAEFAKATADANDFALSLNVIEFGSRAEREAEKATTMTLKELRVEYAKHVEMAQEKKRAALEASDAALRASKKEREEAVKWAEEKKKVFADEMKIVKQYEKAAFAKAAEIEKAYKAEAVAAWAASDEKAAAAVAAYLREKDAFQKAREAAQEENDKIRKAYEDVYDSVFPAEISEGGFARALDDFAESLEADADAILEKEKNIASEKEAAAAATAAEGSSRISDASEVLKTEKEINTEKQKALNAEAKARGAGWRRKDPSDNVSDPWKNRQNPWDDRKINPPLPDIPAEVGGKGKIGDKPRGQEPWQLTLSRIEGELRGVRKDLTGGGGGAA